MKEIIMYESEDGLFTGTKKETMIYEAEKQLGDALNASRFWYSGSLNIDNAKDFIKLINSPSVSVALNDYDWTMKELEDQ